MLNQRYIELLVTLIVTLLLLNCGKKSGSDKITLKLVHWYGNQRDLWQREVVETYEKEHPNIKIELETIPFQMYYSKILAATASGAHIGDVVAVDDWFAQELFKRNFTTDLQPFFNRDLKVESFYTTMLDGWRWKGNLMAFPTSGGVTVLFYNKDLFDAAGVTYPDSTWTYDDLLAAAKKLTKDTDGDGRIDQWGFLVDDGTYTALDTQIYSLGGHTLSPELSRCELESPESIEALQFLVDMVNKQKISPPPLPQQALSQEFMSGKYAMIMMGDFAKLSFKDTPFRWDIAMPPKGTGGRHSIRFGNAFCIPTTSQHKDEAWKLLKWIITFPGKEKIDELFYTMMPAYKPLATSKEWLNGVPRCNRAIIPELYEKYSLSIMTPGWLEWREHGLIPEMQNAFALRKTVREAARDASREINEVLRNQMNP